MSISARDRKILWTRAGNQCAFPGCQQTLVDTQGSDPNIVIGEEAHIVPKKAGPREDESVPDEGVDSYANIVLLCPTHHTVVDKARGVFTKQALIAMKRAHEFRMRTNVRHTELLPAVTAVLHESAGSRLVDCWQVESSIVVIDSYGSPPVRQHDDRWRAAGIRIGQAHIKTPQVMHWLFDSSEAKPDVEYWSSESKLYLVQETFLYDDGRWRFAPFGHWSKLAGYLLASAAHSRRDGVPAAMRPGLLVPNTRHAGIAVYRVTSTKLKTL